MLVKYTQPNLIGGVSQQPPALRSPAHCTEMVNGYPSPVDGAIKRPPTQRVADLGAAEAYQKFHTVYRDGEEQYLLRVSPSGITGIDLSDGSAVTISDPDTLGWSYLSTTDAQNLELFTVGDTTFVLNRFKVASMDSFTTAPVNTKRAILFLRQGDYSSTYTAKLKLNNVVYSTVETRTWKGTGSAAAGEIASVKTDDIMADLASQINALGITGLTATQSGSIVELDMSGITTVNYIETEDSIGDTALSAIWQSVPRVEGWLPEVCRDGYKVEIVGDGEVDADNYWVEFRTDGEDTGGIGKGKWFETVAPEVETTLDPATMPHLLISTGAGTFNWTRPDWGTRTVGDADTNPDPSFIGQRLNNLFFYKDRLGILAGSQVVLSEAGDYYNFFRSTMLTLRDSGVIDVTTTHTKVAIFENAVPFNENMLLFSARGQFILRGSDILSPRTVQILPVAEFESNTTPIPEPTAKSVFFPFERGDQSGLREIFQTGDILTFDAIDTTVTVPNYIQGSIVSMASSTLENTLLALTESTDGVVYLYRYLWSGNQKAQSAWCKWQFPGTNVTVKHAAFVENTLYLVLNRDGSDFVEKLVLATGVTDEDFDFVVHLDRRITEAELTSATYDAASKTTTLTLPYTASASETFGVVDRDTGVEIPVFSQTTTTAVLQGDYSAANLYVGTVYELVYTFTVPVIKFAQGQGVLAEYEVPQMVNFLNVQYAGSRSFAAEVTVGNRATKTLELPAVSIGTGAVSFGSVGLLTGEFKVPIMGRAVDSTVVLRNDTPYPSNLSSASWDIQYHSKARRV
jgi:hypothetical protein